MDEGKQKMDLTWLIEILATCAGIGLGSFIISEIIGFFNTRAATNSIVQTATTSMNAIVAMTGVGVTSSQAAAVTEVAGVPTQIIVPPK